MLTVRIIPCLDIRNGRIVKGVKFQGLRDAGDPAERAAEYEAQGADELVFLDVSATDERRKTQIETVKAVRAAVSIPITVGGGVTTAQDAGALLDAGADKVSMNSAAVARPALVEEVARRFGTQCTVVAIDAKANASSGWDVVVRGGKDNTGIDVLQWSSNAVELGAGEILLTSWDRDGTRSGYDLELLASVSDLVTVPIIASGGGSTADHFIDALEHGADALLAASIFHDSDTTVAALKSVLHERGVPIRL